MKIMNLSWIVAVMAGSIALGQEDAPPAFERANNEEELGEEIDPFNPFRFAPKAVRVRVEFIELPHKTATKLLMEDKSISTDATALRMKVQALVDKDEAKVIETQVLVCRSGQKATVESILEVIYPTEYEPPGQNTELLEKEQKAKYANNPAVPTSFETRNVGCTLEVEPTITDDDNLIDMRFVPELSWHTGNRVWYEGKDTAGNSFKVSTPDFYVVRLNTSMTCVVGQYFMAGVLSPKNAKGELDQDRKVMTFVKCDILAAVP